MLQASYDVFGAYLAQAMCHAVADFNGPECQGFWGQKLSPRGPKLASGFFPASRQTADAFGNLVQHLHIDLGTIWVQSAS